MTMQFASDGFLASDVLDLLRTEREKALSAREWKHRMAGYGYAIKDTDAGMIVTKLFSDEPLCAVPSDMAA